MYASSKYFIPTETAAHSNKLSTPSVGVQDLAFKLECAMQQIQVMKLEKIEYEKEIAQITKQNQTLFDENTALKQSSHQDITTIQLLSRRSIHVEHINDCNLDLHSQISEHKKLIHKLQSEITTLQSKNTTLQTALEHSQKRESMHINNALQSKNTMKRLQSESDLLRQQLCHSYDDSGSDEKQSENIEYMTQNRHNSDIFQLKLYSSMNQKSKRKSRKNSEFSHCSELNEEPLFFELENEHKYSEESVSILNQLQQFGYNKSEIITAVNNVQNKGDINEIVDNIDNSDESQCYNEQRSLIRSFKVRNEDLHLRQRSASLSPISSPSANNKSCFHFFNFNRSK